MNWVGGSRSRYMKSKEDTTKQRAFFQKQRMKRKSNIVDSPKAYNPENMDLLTLFIVNQIASKKEQTEKTKTNLLTDVIKNKRASKEPSELPMSPCSPSNLDLVTSQPQYCIDTPAYKVRRHRLSEEFKFTPLSPLLESNLSDASGSEIQPHPPSTSSGSLDPIQTKPAPHISSSPPALENLNNMKNTSQFVSFSQPTKLANPWPDKALMQGVSHKFESTLPNPERGEHSEASVLYPLNAFKSTEEPEESLFIDFKNIDYKVINSMNSCDRSENTDSNGHLSTQLVPSWGPKKCPHKVRMYWYSYLCGDTWSPQRDKYQEFVCTDSNRAKCADGSRLFVHVDKSPRGVHLSSDDKEKNDQCLQCACPKKLLCQVKSVKAKHCCLSVDTLTETASQAPSCKEKAESNCDGQSETEAQREHNGSVPITLETGTQTGALSYRDVSVQCSLIHHRKSVPFPLANQKTSTFTTRWQYSNFNQLLNPTTHTSPKTGHKRTGNMACGQSATNQQTQRHAKPQMGFSFRKIHSQKSMKRDLTSASKHLFCKASEQKKEESRKKMCDKCDYPQLGNVARNPVKDVRRAGEFVKEMTR